MSTDTEQAMDRQEKIRERIQELRYIDDFFMTAALRDPKCVKCILDTILEKDLVIRTCVTQKLLSGLNGSSARLDAYADDSEGREYAVEVQRSDAGARPKRARRNSSFLDADFGDGGEYGERLPITFVIFITESDPLKGGLPLYHIERTVQETGALFPDEAHIIYVNSQIQDDTPLGRLMHDFWSKSASEIYNKPLADRMRALKETEEGVETMCQFSEELLNEGIAIGKAEGKAEGRAEGRAEGMAEGRAEGRAEGETRLASLIQKLLAASRGEDIQKAVSDPEYRSILYGQYGIAQ